MKRRIVLLVLVGFIAGAIFRPGPHTHGHASRSTKLTLNKYFSAACPNANYSPRIRQVSWARSRSANYTPNRKTL